MKTTAVTLAAIFSLAITAQAQLSIVNGDFNADITGTDLDSVPYWSDANPAAFWEAAWLINRVQPNYSDFPTPGVIFSGANAPGDNYLYQNIGIPEEGDAAMALSFELGSFSDAPSPGERSGTLTVSLFQFQTGDDILITDVLGATLLDSQIVETGPLTAGEAILSGTTLSLGSATLTDSVYLHFEMDGEWIGMDNVVMEIVPEPTTFALGGLGLAALAVFRRRR